MSNIKKTLILTLLFVPGLALADGSSKSEVNVPTIEEKVNLDLTSAQPVVLKEPVKEEAPQSPAPVIHEVQEGDTLSAIAEENKTVWTRIYDANADIQNPDMIMPGEKLRVPCADEQVAPRALPTPPEPVAPVVPIVAPVVPAYHVEASVSTTSTTVSSSVSTSELVGSYGYVVAGSNCVNTAKAHGKNQPGNPIEWAPTTQTPFVGAAALFSFNHVAIVSGIHSNGDIEVIHENCPSCPTRYARSSFRGFF